MNVEFDMREVTRLAARIPRAEVGMVAPLAAVVTKTATELRDDLREKAGGHARFPYLPKAITYDVRGLTAEIGPDKNRRGGAIGNIVYFGTVNNGPVLEHPAAALARARPGFEAAVAAVAVRGLAKGIT